MVVFDNKKRMEESLRKIMRAMEDVSIIVEMPQLILSAEYVDDPVMEERNRPGIFAGRETGSRQLTLRITYADVPEIAQTKKERLRAVEEELVAELARVKKELGD